MSNPQQVELSALSMSDPQQFGDEKDLVHDLKSSRKIKVIMSILLILLISLSLLVCYLFLINESKTIETKVEQNGLACETVKQNGLGCDPKFVFIYIWIGDNMPDKYKKNYLKSRSSDYQRYQKDYNLSVPISNVAKSDLLRASWLYQHGGVYSDLDNDVDYCCIVQKYKDQKGVSIPENTGNSFMYASQPHAQLFNRLLKDVNKRQNATIIQFMGPPAYWKVWNGFMHEVKLGNCLNHTLDFTWRDEKNKW